MKLGLASLVVASVLVLGFSQAFAESTIEEDKEEIVYFSLEENPELVKERVADAFWNNPLDTPPMLILIGIIPILVIIAWKRKWHIHEKKENLQ